MGFYCTAVVVTALLLLSISAKLPVVVVVAKDYRVGGTDGWTFGPDFLQWSEQYNFTVGDVLSKKPNTIQLRKMNYCFYQIMTV